MHHENADRSLIRRISFLVGKVLMRVEFGGLVKFALLCWHPLDVSLYYAMMLCADQAITSKRSYMALA